MTGRSRLLLKKKRKKKRTQKRPPVVGGQNDTFSSACGCERLLTACLTDRLLVRDYIEWHAAFSHIA